MDASAGVLVVGIGMCLLPLRGSVAVPYIIRAQSNSIPSRKENTKTNNILHTSILPNQSISPHYP